MNYFYATNFHYLTTFLFERLGECTETNLGVNGVNEKKKNRLQDHCAAPVRLLPGL